MAARRPALLRLSLCLLRRGGGGGGGGGDPPRPFHHFAGAQHFGETRIGDLLCLPQFQNSDFGFPRRRAGTGGGGFGSGASGAAFERGYRSVPTCRFGGSARNSWSAAGAYSTASAVEVEEVEDSASRESGEIGYEVLGQFSPSEKRTTRQTAFAVIQVGAHQFKVSPGDLIYTEKLKNAAINEKLLLNRVLLMGSLRQTIIGRPTVPTAGVLAVVEEHALDAKVIIFKKKRRKNYRRTRGHRQELTRLRILHIEGIEGDEAATPSGHKDLAIEEGSA